MKNTLSQIHIMNTLLGSRPSRTLLLQTPKMPVQSHYTIRVERTCPFEWIEDLMPAFTRLWGAQFSAQYSGYDSTLSKISLDEKIDVYLFWLDWRLYQQTMSPKQAVDWLKQRITTLRKQSSKPVLLNNWFEYGGNGEMLFSPIIGERKWTRELNAYLSELPSHIPHCHLIDLAGLTCEVDGSFYDNRNDTIGNFPFSDQAAITIARHLGVHLLPALFRPRIKAIVLDLDDTLYQGVLGEDGVEGIQLTDGHRKFQNLLLRLKRSGILLAINSRNEVEDVNTLFTTRTDFPLKQDDFAVICANWKPKSDNMVQISKQFNIDPEDFLFVDDNVSELLKVAAVFPSLRILQAEPDGKITMNKMLYYPGLYQFHADDSASLRTSDIQANKKREQLKAQARDYYTYLSELEMKLRIYINHIPHKNRLHELSQKTNQFNLALQRYNLAEVERMLTSEQHLIFTVHLQDCLSDSGVIGSFIFRCNGQEAHLLEVTFSCRALGREVETVSFAHCLRYLLQKNMQRLHITIVKGKRNSPAIQWIRRYAPEPGTNFMIQELYSKVEASCSDHPAKVEEIK